jgi:hypothetical protein
MLQTYEAVLQPNGSLQFLDFAVVATGAPRRVLVTFTEEFAATDTALCGATLSESALAHDWQRQEEVRAWQHFAGALKNSPHLNDDPLSIQQAIRHEWD